MLGPGGVGGAVPGGGAPPRAPGGPAGGSGNAPAISNERRPGLNYGGSKKKGSKYKGYEIVKGEDPYNIEDGYTHEVHHPEYGMIGTAQGVADAKSIADSDMAERAALQSAKEAANVEVDDSAEDGVRTRERRDEDTVVRLPRASKKRNYRLLDED
jgi:hypothetical protein